MNRESSELSSRNTFIGWTTLFTVLGSLMLVNTAALGAISSCSMGATAIGDRRFEAAQALLWQCVVSEERQPQDAVNLTFSYRALKNYADGLQSVEVALKQMPKNEDLHYISAFLFFRTQQYARSMSELSTAYRMKPDDWRIHQLFALNFIEDGNNQSDSYAEQEFARAIKLNPHNAELYYQLSRLYYTQQRFSEAIAASSRAIVISPDYEEAYDNLALSYQAYDDIPRAIEGFSRAINLTAQSGHSDPWPYINYAALLEKISPGSAISLLKQAIIIDPQNADANYHLGRCLDDVGQPTEALGYYERAISINPNYDRAYYALSMLLRTRDPERSAALLRQFRALKNQETARKQIDLTGAVGAP